MIGYRPLVYFWIAEYTDGSALPQFDPETGKENMFLEVNQQKLERFGWYPFSMELFQKILKTEKILVVPTKNPSYTISLEQGDKLVAYRTNTIKLRIHKGGAAHKPIVYVLGVEGKQVMHIDEGGNLIDDSS
ncbi:MAG: hypothetical protein NWF06_10635 [Candidatus Bathyarchaeota archaeon]|nr:hypothetical protein [Candidatus Bathyarchaeum sp.]